MNKIDKHIENILTFINKYETFVKKVIFLIRKCIFKVINFLRYIMNIYIGFFAKFARFARYTTKPVHWLLILFDIWKMKPKEEDIPLLQLGAHYIYGKPGSGKSTMTYHAMTHNGYLSGKAALTTAQMEIPRLSLSGAEYYLHQRFSPSDLFQEGQQTVSIDSNKFNMIVYEEMLTYNNQRNNKNSSYNNEFLPLIGAIGTQRHQGIDIFYFISQLPRNDIQLMQILSYYHIPKVKKGFDYEHWLETGKYRFTIKGWHVESYEITPKGSSDYELTNKKKWFYKNEFFEDMKFFNRLNMKKEFSNKPKLKLEARL